MARPSLATVATRKDNHLFRNTRNTTLDLDALFNASPNAYVLLDPQLVIVGCNDAYLEAVGRSSRDEIIGRYLFEAFPADPASTSYQLLKSSFDRVVATQRYDTIALIPYDTSGPDEPPRMRYWSATHTPVFDADGVFRYILQHTVDVTELRLPGSSSPRAEMSAVGVLQRAAEVQAANELLSSETALIRSLFRQAPGFMTVLIGPDHVFALTNGAYEELVGRSNLVGKSVAEALPEIVDQGFIRLLDQVMETGEPYIGRGIHVRLATKADTGPQDHYLDFVYQPFRDAAGNVAGVFVQGHDITEQKKIEQRLETLAQESAHRVKNLLAIVQAIVSQTLRRADDIDSAAELIRQRLMAIGATQTALVSGSAASSELAALVQSAMNQHAVAPDRVTVSGPPVQLDADTALGLTLVLHELGTNALKYGALSNDAGRVEISWTRGGDHGDVADFLWQERGGPPVTPPARQGFGSALIQKSLPPVDDEGAEIDYTPDGLVFRARLRVAARSIPLIVRRDTQ